jgi:hypothetical protein
MLKALKYIIIFLLGYKIIKELFGYKQRKNIKKPTVNSSIGNEAQYNVEKKHFDNAEDIDFEELK